MSKPTVSAVAVEDLLKPVLLKDLRLACRARGLNPGGSRDTLFERVKEHMLQTGNL
jgi:SPIRAL1-like protein